MSAELGVAELSSKLERRSLASVALSSGASLLGAHLNLLASYPCGSCVEAEAELLRVPRPAAQLLWAFFALQDVAR